MNVRLVVDKGGQRKVVPIHHDQAVIGRSHGNTVRIPSAEVSRQHCRLSKKDGLVMVRDLGSVNGTLLNGHRISAEEIVRPGDRVEVGPVTFVVEYELTPDALDHLHGLDQGVDVLAALADGDIVDVELADEIVDVELDEDVEFESLDEVEAVEFVDSPGKKKPKPLADAPTRPDDLDLLPVDFDFDAAGWQLPEADDLRGLLDDAEDEPPKKKGKPKK